MFEWDADKNDANIEKHGVGFATASRIFEGFVLSVVDDRYDYGEVRENTIGLIDGVLFLTVTHTDRGGITRIISARPAKRAERDRYDQALRKRADSRTIGSTSGQ